MSNRPHINWDAVQTPFVSYPGFSLKDPALVWHDGWFQMACSVFDEANHSQLMTWRSRDLASWEGPMWSLGAGTDGYCSPDIIQHDGRYIMTFQSWDAIPPRDSKNQLFYATSDDAASWSAPKPLAANVTQGVRAIDAALAHHQGMWYCLYKEAQTPRLAKASDIDGPWEQLGNPLSCWAENGQFLQIDGTWHMLATLLEHQQGIAAIDGDPDRAFSWTSWQEFRHIETPIIPGFNEGSAANASSMWGGRALDGYWYRVFCAAQNPPDGNWGYELGIARSTDLVTWEMP